MQLLKAFMYKDLDEMEALGGYEVALILVESILNSWISMLSIILGSYFFVQPRINIKQNKINNPLILTIFILRK